MKRIAACEGSYPCLFQHSWHQPPVLKIMFFDFLFELSERHMPHAG